MTITSEATTVPRLSCRKGPRHAARRPGSSLVELLKTGGDKDKVKAFLMDIIAKAQQEDKAQAGTGAEEIEAIGAAEEGHFRVVEDFGFELGALGFGDVGEIGDDEVKGAFDGGEEVALEEGGFDFESGGIFSTKGEGVCG